MKKDGKGDPLFDATVRTQPGVYHVAFSTSHTKGYLAGVKVTLELDLIPDDSNLPTAMQEKMRVDLSAHPLYQHLREYCLANKP